MIRKCIFIINYLKLTRIFEVMFLFFFYVQVLAQRLSTYVHAYTLTGAMRPFGVCIMLACYTPHEGPELYMIEPSGLYYVSARCI
jgi:20S proteasome alpha/beta subunit